MAQGKKLTFLTLIGVVGALVLLEFAPLSQTRKVKVGTNAWIGFESLYLAKERGFLSPSEVHLVEYSSSTSVMQGLRSGTLDGAGLTLDEALTLCSEGLALKLVLIMSYSKGADALVAKPDILNLKDLKGKRIAYESSALGAFMLSRVLDAASLSIENVQLKESEVNQHLRIYESGQVDAVVTFEPFLTSLLSLGGRVLFDSTQIPGEIVDVLAFRSEIVSDHEREIEHLIEAHFKALKEIQQDPLKVAPQLQKRLKLPLEDIVKSLKLVHLPLEEENRAAFLENKITRTIGRLSELPMVSSLFGKPINSQELFVHPADRFIPKPD